MSVGNRPTLYYECHITVEPVFEDRLDQLKTTIALFQFWAADLLMKKRSLDTEQRSQYDTFCSSRSSDVEDLVTRMLDCMTALKSAGFKIWRYKIESVMLDSRYNDEFRMLDPVERLKGTDDGI